MIGFLRGVLISKSPPTLLLDVGGIGYEVDAPMSTFYELPESGSEVRLFTHLSIREDAHNLYGFISEEERSLFRTLIRVNGVGARLALAILSSFSVEEFHRCVEYQEASQLVRIPGVGKKTAERLIVELRDRLPKPGNPPPTQPGNQSKPSTTGAVDDATAALIALGFKPQDAEARIRSIDPEGKSREEIIRTALQSAAK